MEVERISIGGETSASKCSITSPLLLGSLLVILSNPLISVAQRLCTVACTTMIVTSVSRQSLSLQMSYTFRQNMYASAPLGESERKPRYYCNACFDLDRRLSLGVKCGSYLRCRRKASHSLEKWGQAHSSIWRYRIEYLSYFV